MKNNQKKTIGMSLAILGIVFAVYNLLVFMIFTPEGPVFWMSYAFAVLAFGLQVVGMYLSFKEFSVQAAFFGIPLAQFTLFYFFAELFVSTVFMIFRNINWKVPFVIQIVLLAIYAVVAIVTVWTRDTAVAVKENIQKKATNMRLNTIEIDMLVEGAKDPELKAQLRRLSETVRYSDPMTNDFVADLDARIKQETLALQMHCDDNNVAFAMDSCKMLQRLYVERNRKLMASK